MIGSSVEEAERNEPPAEPTAGQCWLVGSAPTGPWSGMTDAIAGWTAGGWRFIVPVERHDGVGLGTEADLALVRKCLETRRGNGNPADPGGTQVVGAQGTPIPVPSGGAVVDAEARAAVVSILAALRVHGLIAP